jgi:hypothetical protein
LFLSFEQTFKKVTPSLFIPIDLVGPEGSSTHPLYEQLSNLSPSSLVLLLPFFYYADYLLYSSLHHRRMLLMSVFEFLDQLVRQAGDGLKRFLVLLLLEEDGGTEEDEEATATLISPTPWQALLLFCSSERHWSKMEDSQTEVVLSEKKGTSLKKHSLLKLILQSLRFLPSHEILSFLLFLTSDHVYLYASCTPWFECFSSLNISYDENDFLVKLSCLPYTSLNINDDLSKIGKNSFKSSDRVLNLLKEPLLPNFFINFFDDNKISSDILEKIIPKQIRSLFKDYLSVLPFVKHISEEVKQKSNVPTYSFHPLLQASMNFQRLLDTPQENDFTVLSCQYSFSTLPLFLISPQFILETMFRSFALSITGGLRSSVVLLSEYFETKGFKYTTPNPILKNGFDLFDTELFGDLLL